MSQVTDEVKQLCPSTKAENWEVACVFVFVSLVSLFVVTPGHFPGAGWSHFM
jgi:hypothetical protein